MKGYGLFKTSPVASPRPPRPGPQGGFDRDTRSTRSRCGSSTRTAEVPQGEVGEIVIRGHNIMKGYWNRPEATAEAIRGGWFRSGDLGTLRRGRLLHVVDRKKDMIIRGGYNVYPGEVEELLYQHPAIREAAVIGVPHRRMGRGGRRRGRARTGRASSRRRRSAPGSASGSPPTSTRRRLVPRRAAEGPDRKIVKREIEIPTPGPRDQPVSSIWRDALGVTSRRKLAGGQFFG